MTTNTHLGSVLEDDKKALNKLVVSVLSDANVAYTEYLIENNISNVEAREYLEHNLDIMSIISTEYHKLMSRDFLGFQNYFSEDELDDIEDLNMRIMKFLMFEDNVFIQGNSSKIMKLDVYSMPGEGVIDFVDNCMNKIEDIFLRHDYLLKKGYVDYLCMQDPVREKLENLNERLSNYVVYQLG